MRWICHLGRGYVLGLDGLDLVRVRMDGLDLGDSQADNLSMLYQEQGFSVSVEKVRQDFAEIVREFNGVFERIGVDRVSVMAVLRRYKGALGAVCFYHDEHLGVYWVENATVLSRIVPLTKFFMPEKVSSLLNESVCMVIPAEFEAEFSAFIEIPKGSVESLGAKANIMLMEGFVAPVLLSSRTFFYAVWVEDADACGRFYRCAGIRLLYAVLPRLGLERCTQSLMQFMADVTYPMFVWESDLCTLPIADVMSVYGDMLRKDLPEAADYWVLSKFIQAGGFSAFLFKFVRDGDLLVYEDKGIVQALSRQYDYFSSVGEYLRGAYWHIACVSLDSGKGKMVLSLKGLFGDALSEYLYWYLCQRKESYRYDCSRALLDMFGVSEAGLAKLVLMSDGSGRPLLDYKAVKDTMKVSDGMTEYGILLHWGMKVMNVFCVEGVYQANLSVFMWMPSAMLARLDFDRFQRMHALELYMVVCCSLFVYLSANMATLVVLRKFLVALKEARLMFCLQKNIYCLEVRWS